MVGLVPLELAAVELLQTVFAPFHELPQIIVELHELAGHHQNGAVVRLLGDGSGGAHYLLQKGGEGGDTREARSIGLSKSISTTPLPMAAQTHSSGQSPRPANSRAHSPTVRSARASRRSVVTR